MKEVRDLTDSTIHDVSGTWCTPRCDQGYPISGSVVIYDPLQVLGSHGTTGPDRIDLEPGTR